MSPVRPVHPGTCGLRMLLSAPGRPGLRRLRVHARPELPGGRGKNPLRLVRPQPVTSPLPPPRPWGLAVYRTAHARRGLPSEKALLGHVLQEPVEGPRSTWDVGHVGPACLLWISFKLKFWCSACWPQVTLAV